MEKSDHDSGSNRNHSARQSDFSVPAATKMDSCEMKQSHSVTESRDRREEEDLPSQPRTPPPHNLPVNRNQEAVTTPSKQRRCKCKASRCLKLYCECFASGSYCIGCNCLYCHNTLEKEKERQEAIKTILERNPDAFKPKIARSPHGINDLKEDVRQLHNKGCHCKRSGCLKKYCECYQANVRCSDNCRCRDCKNFEGNQEIKQTTNAAVKVAIGMSCYLHPTESTTSASHSVATRGSPHLVQNQTVDYVVRSGDTSLFTVPNFEGSKEIQHTTNAALKDMSPESIKRKIKSASSHSVAARGSPHLVQNEMVDYVVRNGDTSLFTVPNNHAVPGSTTSTYRSSLSDTIQQRHVKELCSLLVSKSVDVAKKMSGANEKDSSLDPSQRDANVIKDSPDCVLDAGTMDEKPMSPPATRALMCDEEHVNISEKETSTRVRTSQENEDTDTSSEVYSEQERQILSCFRDCLIQILNRGSINGTNIQETNTDPSRKEPEDEEQNNRDSSLGA